MSRCESRLFDNQLQTECCFEVFNFGEISPQDKLRRRSTSGKTGNLAAEHRWKESEQVRSQFPFNNEPHLVKGRTV